MSLFWIILLVIGAIAALTLLAGAFYGRSRPKDPLGPVTGLSYMLARQYARSVHQLRVIEDPGALDDLTGPLIVVCNHTAGVDPILVSLSMPVRVRWLMADDMRLPWLDWFWKWHGIIFIARNRHGRTGLRQARGHLNNKGIIGIFPEGKIERPSKRLLPFAPGVGVLVRRSGARVLPVVIDGTPQVEPAWNALWTTSNASVHYHTPIEYADTDMSAAEISQDLQNRFQEWTGWPVSSNTNPMRSQPPEHSSDANEHASFDENLDDEDNSMVRHIA